jgi:hypothetical protein
LKRKLTFPEKAFDSEATTYPSSLVPNLASAVAATTAAVEAWILEPAFVVERIRDETPDSEGIPGFVAELAAEGTPLVKCAHVVLACWVRQKTVTERDADLEHLRSVAFCGASWTSLHLSSPYY